MRTHIIALLALLFAMAVPPCPTLAQTVATADVKKAVEEYSKPETTAERRQKLVVYLLGARNTDITAAIRNLFKKKPLSGPALELAVKLHLRGLGGLAELSLEEHPENAATLALMSGDKAAVKALFVNWSKADRAGDLYKGVNAAFLKHGVDWPVIEEIRNLCVAKETEAGFARDLLSVLKFQLGTTELTVKQLADEWDKVSAGLEQDSARQPQDGIDLVALGAIKLERTVRRGPNLRINEGGKVFFDTLPEGMAGVSMRLTASVFIETDEPTAYVHLTIPMGNQTGYRGVVIRGDKWTVNVTGEAMTVKPKRWVRVSFDIVYRPKQPLPFSSMKVDQASAFSNIHHDEFGVQGLVLGSHLGTMLVSGIGWEKI